MRVLRWLKHKAAAWLLDAPRYALALRYPTLGWSWTDLCNRGERLLRLRGQRGVAFDWQWSSALFYCQAYPPVGQRVLARALEEWPIRFGTVPAATDGPLVSFVIGHRGRSRLPHLLTTLGAIAGQVDCAVECVVVEQANETSIADALPRWVRHVQTALPAPDMPYSRSWAFNVGAREARGEYLILHDNDLLPPAGYAAEAVRVLARGFEAARLQRFIFYLNEADSNAVMGGNDARLTSIPTEVVQNNHGGTIAVRRDVFFALGGYDEGFVGWGGEDNELFDRLRTRRLHEGTYLPFVHLWHPPQPGKQPGHPNFRYYVERSKTAPTARIGELVAGSFGDARGPRLMISGSRASSPV